MTPSHRQEMKPDEERLFTQQQWEPSSWISFKFWPKMVVIRNGLWTDLSRISPVQLPGIQIKPAAAHLMEFLLHGQTDGPEDV